MVGWYERLPAGRQASEVVLLGINNRLSLAYISSKAKSI